MERVFRRNEIGSVTRHSFNDENLIPSKKIGRMGDRATAASPNTGMCRLVAPGRAFALAYLATFDAGGAAMEGGVRGEVATGALFRNFFSGMS